MIGFYNKDVRLGLKNKRLLKKWIRTVAEEAGKRCGEISVIFCSDGELLEMNRRFLQHDYYTDIITFDYCDGRSVSGDLYISLDTVRANAQEYGEGFERELHRVIIHGVLHLLGLPDASEEEGRRMREAENRALARLSEMMREKEREDALRKAASEV